MSEILSKTLRPKKFSQFFGQDKIIRAIRNQIASGRNPQAWMFSGEQGSGKTSIGRVMGVSYNCPHQKVFGEPCLPCRKRKRDFQIAEINASLITKVEELKEVASQSTYYPTPPAIKRVFLLDEAHSMSKSSQNMFLKYFEDPPETTIWIVCTTDPEAIIDTLRGRCIKYPMRPLRSKTVDQFVRWAAKKGNVKRPLDEFIEFIQSYGLTSARSILLALEKYAAGLDPDQSISGDESEVDTHLICQSLVQGEWPPIRLELEKATVDDAKFIQQSVIGYLRSILLAKQSTIKPAVAADAIIELSRMGFMEKSTASAYICALLNRLCKKFPG